MVKVSKAVQAKNKEKMIKAAGQIIRERGLPNASVANIAKRAGLTHGAVYKSFPTKEDLAAAAVRSDFEKILQLLKAVAENGGTHMDYVKAYLAKSHRDDFSWGCPAGALSSEISKSDDRVQAAFLEGCLQVLKQVQSFEGSAETPQARARSIHLISTLVGGLAMARATKTLDPHLSDEILTTNCDMLAQTFQAEPSSAPEYPPV